MNKEYNIIAYNGNGMVILEIEYSCDDMIITGYQKTNGDITDIIKTDLIYTPEDEIIFYRDSQFYNLNDFLRTDI